MKTINIAGFSMIVFVATLVLAALVVSPLLLLPIIAVIAAVAGGLWLQKQKPAFFKYVHPLGMPLGIAFGVVSGAGLQWIRDGGVAQGAAGGLLLGIIAFGPVFSQWLSRRSSKSV